MHIPVRLSVSSRHWAWQPGRRCAPQRARAWSLAVWLALAWSAHAQTTAPAAVPAAAAAAQSDNAGAEAAAPSPWRPAAAAVGVEVPREVKAASALLGLGRQRLALVVGNGKLAGRDVLDSAYRDSRAVAAALRAGGFIVMAREDLTGRDLRASLLEFRSRLQPGGIGFVYIAALGAQLDGQNLLLPRELDLSGLADGPSVAAQLKAGGVPLAEVVDALMSTPDSPRLLVVDAAYRHPALALLPTAGLGAQALPPGMMALFGHALHGVQEVPAVAPLGDNPPDDPRELAASTFGRVLVGAMLTDRIKPADMLRRTRSALFDASGGEFAPWLGGDTASDETFAEESLTALLPRTPEELAREAVRGGVRNLVRARGAGSSVVSPATTVTATAPAAGNAGLGDVQALPGGAQMAAAEPSPQAVADDGVRRPLRANPATAQPSPALAEALADPPQAPTSLVSTLGSVASTVGGVAGAAATVATVAAGVKAAETLLVAQAAGTAATAAVGAVGAVGTAGSVLANAAALGARVVAGSGGGAETAVGATALAAAPTAASSVSTAAAAATAAAEPVAQAAAVTAGATALAAAGEASAGADVATAGATAPPSMRAAATAATVPAGASTGVAAGAGADPLAQPPVSTTPTLAATPSTLPATARPALAAPATALAGSALAPDAPAQPASLAPPVLPPPKFNPYGYGEGDTFLYQVTDLATEQVSGSFMHTVEHVAADGSLRGNGDLLRLDPQGRLQSMQRPDGTQARFEPYQDLWQAAPQPGQTRPVRFTEHFQRPDGSRGRIDWQGQSEVGRAQTVRTPGGEFQALPIETAGRFVETVEGAGATNGRWRRTVWYAPQLGHPVAIDIHDIDLNGRAFRRQRIELTQAQRATRQP